MVQGDFRTIVVYFFVAIVIVITVVFAIIFGVFIIIIMSIISIKYILIRYCQAHRIWEDYFYIFSWR